MNLIEQFGGYERAKHEFEMIKEMKPIYPGEIETNDRLLLEYRRQHNIFEVGDKVVHHKFSNMKIYEICEISGDLFTVFYDRKSHSFKTDVRHATDAEIEVGKRLEVNQ